MKKVVLITGISSGFGKEISHLLAEKGHVVYGTLRSECKVAPGIKTLNVELADPETITNAVDAVIKNEGRIDVLINNAGMHTGGPIEDTPMEMFEAQMKVNYFGWVRLIKAVLPHMRAQKSGTIINISSIGGITSLPFQGVYAASKFAVEGLSTALRMELKPFNIKVVVVNPGDFKTRNTETRKISLSENSPYQAQFEKTLGIIEKDETGGADPARLAWRIGKIIEAENPSQRYLVGALIQKLAVVVKRITPERFFNSLLANHYGIK